MDRPRSKAGPAAVLDPLRTPACNASTKAPFMAVPSLVRVIVPAIVPVGVTEKLTPLLACPPVVTTTDPVVEPAGTAATMLAALQLVGVAVVPLKVTVLSLGRAERGASDGY